MKSKGQRSLRSLLPKNFIFAKNISALIDSFGLSIERIRIFFNGIKTESNPSTAVDTIEQWYDQLGIKYDSTDSITDLQKIASATYTNVNLPTPDYIQEKISETFSNIIVEESGLTESFQVGKAVCGLSTCGNSNQFFYYVVRGTVPNSNQLSQLKALLSRIVPTHLVPIYDVEIS